MIKVRISPLLRALGFKHLERGWYIYKQEDKVFYEARIYKRGGEERYIEINKTHYDDFGHLHHRSLICKNLCLDIPVNQLGSIIIWISCIAKEIGNFENIITNMNYWLGLDTERHDKSQFKEKKDVL